MQLREKSRPSLTQFAWQLHGTERGLVLPMLCRICVGCAHWLYRFGDSGDERAWRLRHWILSQELGCLVGRAFAVQTCCKSFKHGGMGRNNIDAVLQPNCGRVANIIPNFSPAARFQRCTALHRSDATDKCEVSGAEHKWSEQCTAHEEQRG